MELVGCTVLELMAHLESLFLPGMTWENRSQWEVDHIKPCASFDFKDPEQQKSCFHYTNLRPLWTADNRKKHAKILSDEEYAQYTGRTSETESFAPELPG
jgi:hypothetical protein